MLHAASVGEVLALKPFVEQLLAREPDLVITFTTFTPTGSAQVTKLFKNRVQHCYLSIDCWPFTWLFLRSLKPTACIFMETELWPNLVAQSRHFGVRLLLINGRLSQKSVHHYQKFSWLIAPCLKRFDAILCQSQDNYENFLTLGAKPTSTTVSGNLKYDISANQDVISKSEQLSTLIKDKRRLLLAASTHAGDEELVIAAYQQLKQEFSDLLLIIVPRHPERFDSVVQLAGKHLSAVRRSTNQAITLDTDVWVIDSLGELLSIYALVDVTIMGGSFSDIGGHNPLEPALFSCPVVVGPDMSNFKDITEQLRTQQGIEQIAKHNDYRQEIVRITTQLFTDTNKAKTIGQMAGQVLKANQGASQRSIETLMGLLTNSH